MSDFKQSVLGVLNVANNLFDQYRKGNNPIGVIDIKDEYHGFATSFSSKSGTFYSNSSGRFGTIACNLPTPGPITSYRIGEQETKDMLHALNSDSLPKHYSTPKLLSDIDAGLVYSLSQCYDIMLLQKDHQLQLLFDQNINTIVSHNSIQYTPMPFIADFYIKYDSQHLDIDLRNGRLPKVDVIIYSCPENAKYVNLPNTSSSHLRISNSGSELLSLNIQQYSEYIKIHPKYLYQHKYIKIVGNKIEINYIKYYSENYNCTGGSKYYFCMNSKVMNIVSKQPIGSLYCVLIPDVVEQLNGISHATYTPSSVTSMMIELEEIKQLIEPLKIQLKVEFDY